MAGAGPNPPMIGIYNSDAFNRMIGSTPKKARVSFRPSDEFPAARMSYDISNKNVTNKAAPASTAAATAAAAAFDGNINQQNAVNWFEN